MKSFLEVWNEIFPVAVTRKLGGAARWEPAEELPAADEAIALEIRRQDGGNDCCVLIGASDGIASLLGISSVVTEKNDLSARWLEWMREIIASVPISAQTLTVDLIERPRGVPLIPYVLRMEEKAVYLAMGCEAVSAASRHADEEAASLIAGVNSNLDLLLDIEVDVSLRFGSRELAIRELLATGPGDVLELDRTISDPVDLVVGDKIVARGEVVLVNGNFGLRVTEVAEPKKCLESVRCLF